MRFLGVDFGFKRIGLATGEETSGLTTPLQTLKASGSLQKDAEQIKKIAESQQVDGIIVGIPYDTDQRIGSQAKICLQLVEKLKTLSVWVSTVDETLSSIEAENISKELGLKLSAHRRIRDTQSARIILERFFNESQTQ